ncbi:unnamed protein product, partial [Sphacelaria rigidula]
HCFANRFQNLSEGIPDGQFENTAGNYSRGSAGGAGGCGNLTSTISSVQSGTPLTSGSGSGSGSGSDSIAKAAAAVATEKDDDGRAFLLLGLSEETLSMVRRRAGLPARCSDTAAVDAQPPAATAADEVPLFPPTIMTPSPQRPQQQSTGDGGRGDGRGLGVARAADGEGRICATENANEMRKPEEGVAVREESDHVPIGDVVGPVHAIAATTAATTTTRSASMTLRDDEEFVTLDFSLKCDLTSRDCRVKG